MASRNSRLPLVRLLRCSRRNLINRQSQLIQSQILVQNQVGIAQSTVDSLSSDGARKTDVDGAKQQLQRAKDNLVSITAQISDIKN